MFYLDVAWNELEIGKTLNLLCIIISCSSGVSWRLTKENTIYALFESELFYIKFNQNIYLNNKTQDEVDDPIRIYRVFCSIHRTYRGKCNFNIFLKKKIKSIKVNNFTGVVLIPSFKWIAVFIKNLLFNHFIL